MQTALPRIFDDDVIELVLEVESHYQTANSLKAYTACRVRPLAFERTGPRTLIEHQLSFSVEQYLVHQLEDSSVLKTSTKSILRLRR